MRRLLPRPLEVICFALLALVFAVVVSQVRPPHTDLGFAIAACPTFLFAAILGLRRSPTWMPPAEPSDTDEL
jgi:hypothetical protein